MWGRWLRSTARRCLRGLPLPRPHLFSLPADAPPCCQVLAVLGYAAENDVESFLEPALHLTSALLADVGE